MIDASIPLQVRPVQQPESPISTFGDIMRIRDMGAQIQLRQAQTEHARQQAEEQRAIAAQKQRELKSAQAAQDYLAVPGQAATFYSTGHDAKLASMVDPGYYANLQKQHATAVQELGAGKAKDLANDQTFLGQAVAALNGAKFGAQDDPSKISALIDSALPQLSQAAQGTRFAGKLPQPGTIRTPEQVDAAAQQLGALFDLHTAALKQKEQELVPQKTQGEINKTAADTANVSAQLPGLQATSDIKSRQAAGMSPEGLLPDEKVKADQAAAELSRQNRQLEEQARHNKTEEGLSGGHLAVSRAAEARNQQIFQQTYGEGANPALVGVDPKLRTQAASAAQKAANEHITAAAAADEMQGLIGLMRSGNKVAYAYAPTTGVLTINSANGVKRVNMAEIKQYEGAGSLVDHITGYLGKQISGASIPANVVDDMEKLHSHMDSVATKAYNSKVEAINQNYRSNFQPVGTKPAAVGAGSAGGKIRVQIPGHPPGTIDAGQKEAFLKEHPEAKVL